MSKKQLPAGMPGEYEAAIAAINDVCAVSGRGEGEEDFDSEEMRAVGINVARARDAAWSRHVAELEATLAEAVAKPNPDDVVDCGECGGPRPRCPQTHNGKRCDMPVRPRHWYHVGDGSGWPHNADKPRETP